MRPIPANVPRAVITLDRPRTLTLQLDALKRLKDRTGSFDVGLDDSDRVFENAPIIVWCALVDEDREGLEPEDVAAMIHAGNLPEVVNALADLVTGSSPEKKGAEGNAIPVPATVRRTASRPSR